METKAGESNLFSDFIKVFTGLLIGLASFQILAPLIWNYLSELLHLEKHTSYYVIVLFYFILPCVLLLIWWFTNKEKITKLLSIKSGNNSHQNSITRILNIFFPLFFLLNFFLFSFSYVFDNAVIFYCLQGISTLVSGIILVKVIINVMGNVGYEGAKKKRKYYSLIIFTSVLFFLFIVFEIVYLSHRDKTKTDDITTFERLKINNKAELYNAFRLNDLREALDNTQNKFKFNLEKIKQMQELSAFDSTLTSNKVSIDVANLIENQQLAFEILKNDSAHLQKERSIDFAKTTQSLLSLVYLIDRISDSIVRQQSSVVLSPPPYHFETMLGYEKIRTITHEDSLSLAVKAANYEVIISVLQTLESNLVRLCKKQLTLVLSNNQMKGVFLFSFSLFIMLCLYLLLKTNEEVFNQLLLEKENEKDESLKLKAEVNKGLLNDTWVIVNILVWLLIPLFKPVTENSILIDKPMQSLTFNRYFTENPKTLASPETVVHNENPLIINYPVHLQQGSPMDTTYLAENMQRIINKIDSLGHGKTGIAAPAYNDTTIKKMLSLIQERLKSMNTTAQEANVLHKTFNYLMEQRKTEKLTDDSFKPTK